MKKDINHSNNRSSNKDKNLSSSGTDKESSSIQDSIKRKCAQSVPAKDQSFNRSQCDQIYTKTHQTSLKKKKTRNPMKGEKIVKELKQDTAKGKQEKAFKRKYCSSRFTLRPARSRHEKTAHSRQGKSKMSIV